MTAPSSFKFALACDVGGAYREVTDDVLFDEGNIPYQWGKTSAFDPSTRPGVYSFTLKNGDGKYTPNNLLTPLATPLVKGMGANWEINGVQRAGTIRKLQIVFPAEGNPDSARMRVTVDDMVGSAARHQVDDLSSSIADAASPIFRWPLDDSAAGAQLRETVRGTPALNLVGGLIAGSTAGVSGSTIPGAESGTLVVSGAGGAAYSGGWVNFSPSVDYGATMGCFGFWFEAGDASATGEMFVGYDNLTSTAFRVYLAGTVQFQGPGAISIAGPAITPRTATFVEVTTSTVTAGGNVTITYTLYVNGVSYGSTSVVIALVAFRYRNPSQIGLRAYTGAFYFARLTHTLLPLNEYPMAGGSATRIAAIASSVPEIVLDAVPPMSTAPLGAMRSGTALALIDEVIRGEQGGLMSLTSGTLLAPVQKLTPFARNRARPVDLTISFNRIYDRPEFVDALTNAAYRMTANGPSASATVTDPAMFPIVGSASTSEQVALRDPDDLREYAGDRLRRGKTDVTPIVSFTIDARSSDFNLWTELLALRPGHRIRITDCPVTQLGYTTWDGWVVGGDELHTGETRSLFTPYLQPAWDVTTYDSGIRYASGGAMTLQSNISAGAASLGIVSTGDLFTTNPARFPQNIRVGREVMTISGVTGAASPQTATISARGVGLVPAIPHAAGELLDVDPLPRYEY